MPASSPWIAARRGCAAGRRPDRTVARARSERAYEVCAQAIRAGVLAPLRDAFAGPRPVHASAPPPLVRLVSRSLHARHGVRADDARGGASGACQHHGGPCTAGRRSTGDADGRARHEPGWVQVRRGLRPRGVLPRRRMHERGQGEAVQHDVHPDLRAGDPRLRGRLPLPARALRGEVRKRREIAASPPGAQAS